tara:strand:- start:505 stop:930 length:426 start_codon:yes stop_codon:yes gene_type:complete
MKEKERYIIKLFNDCCDTSLVEEQYEYSRFDAQDDFYIAEIKSRKQHYNKTIIEFDKYAYNIMYSKLNNKRFIYIVEANGELYAFDITELDQVLNYDFKWEFRDMPITTEFGNNETIKKYVGYIDINKACIHIKDKYRRKD